MKIGILTQPLHNNYGGLLQNYALQQVLKGMGHEVETVDWFPKKPGVLKEWLWQKKEMLLSLMLKDREFPRYQLTNEEEAVIGRYTQHFTSRYITVCPQKADRIEDFYAIDTEYKYDAYVVGSDQVWRPSYNVFQKAMFLDFVTRKDVKRIAYAASFGTSRWEFTPTMTEICAQLAKKFDLVTVREKSGVDLCRVYLGVNAQQVIDPTMLLRKEDYENLVLEENEPKSDGTLFYYILDPTIEKKNFIEKYAGEHGMNPYTIMPKCQAENRTRKDVKRHIEDCIFPSVTSWLRGFMDAKTVIVDSFHGAVFSIIFNKPFWVIDNNKRGNARFDSLFKLLGLEDRMVDTMNDFYSNKPIDWQRVNYILETKRNECHHLLLESTTK